MSKYLLIASRDPFESGDIGHYYDLAADLAKAGNEVMMFLVQNGVLPARRGSRSAVLSSLAAAGSRLSYPAVVRPAGSISATAALQRAARHGD